MIEGNVKIINNFKRILYFNQLEQQCSELKILTPNQTLSRLPITLAQLKTLHRSKKLTKQFYKSLVDII